jgi:hypothetical protein
MCSLDLWQYNKNNNSTNTFASSPILPLTTANKPQESIDHLYESIGLPSLDALAVDLVIAWVESDGWDEAIVAWQSLDEMCVVHWAELCREYANDTALRDYGLAPKDLTDEDRVEYLKGCFYRATEDSETSPSVHPIRLTTTSGDSFIFGALGSISGHSPSVSFIGLYRSTETFIEDLNKTGYITVDSEIEGVKVLRAWVYDTN